GIQREWLAVSHVENADRESGVEQPLAVAFGKPAQQLHHARRPENDEWLSARRLGRVLEGVHEHRQLAPMIRVEMCEDDVRHLLPGEPELGEPVQRARTAVEQHTQLAARYPMTGADAAGRRRNSTGADGDEFHGSLSPKDDP